MPIVARVLKTTSRDFDLCCLFVQLHQVVFRAPVKKSGLPVPSPLSTHATKTKTNTTPLAGTTICVQ